jgi:hypothetical protein
LNNAACFFEATAGTNNAPDFAHKGNHLCAGNILGIADIETRNLHVYRLPLLQLLVRSAGKPAQEGKKGKETKQPNKHPY